MEPKKVKKFLKIANLRHYKPLKRDVAGERMVHILKNFVLRFSINEPR